jgi:hypothetical protein
MRTLPLVVLVTALLGSAALAQQRERAAEVHCELDQAKAGQDTILLEGKDITLKGSGKISIEASGDVIIKGSSIKQN